MRLSQRLIDEFHEFAARRKAVALLTVVGTEGSTYSKSGGQILIGLDGHARGLLSGGCLEGDLAEQAAVALQESVPRVVDYDLREDDDVFGLGVGCEGLLRIHIQPLLAKRDYAPFKDCLDSLTSTGDALLELCDKDDKPVAKFRLERPFGLLLLGAGQDVDPLLTMTTSLGWHVLVADHREAYVSRLRSLSTFDVQHGMAEAIDEQIDLGRFDAAVVMSHHLATDRSYLQRLAASPIPYIGLLGPPHRRDRLLAEIGDAAHALQGRLRAPVGRRIGGRGPAAIALEITAELQDYCCSLDEPV